MIVAGRIVLTLGTLVTLVLFWLLVTVMNVATALWDSGALAWDVGSRVLGNVWSNGEANT